MGLSDLGKPECLRFEVKSHMKWAILQVERSKMGLSGLDKLKWLRFEVKSYVKWVIQQVKVWLFMVNS